MIVKKRITLQRQNLLFHHEIDMVLQVTSASTDQNPEEFQEGLSKSQKKKKKKALQSQRTEPYLTRGRKKIGRAHV